MLFPRTLAALAVVACSGPLLSFAAEENTTSGPAVVRSFAGSAVRWTTWGDAAFARAKAENKPLYVVVGPFTNELARAMRAQSFANETIATKLNESFVCVVVDRDAQPALAALLAEFVFSTKQARGWPLNVWLTPELKPIEGATYLPPSEEWGREGLTNVVNRVATAWSSDPEGVRARAEQALADFSGGAGELPPPAVDAKPAPAKVDAAFAARRTGADAAHGGAGDPPRGLEPELWSEQLARGGADRALALAALRSLVASPTRDPLDGGFFRAGGDLAWQRPVLVKTAADQARVALALLAAAAEEPAFRDVATSALRFAVKTFQHADGGFATSVDALDEAGAPGVTWTATELRAAGDEAEADAFLAALGAKPEGNVAEADDASGKLKGRNYVALRPASSAKWATPLAKLRGQRDARLAWQRDTNVRTAVNGLLLGVLSRAARETGDAELKAAAEKSATFVLARVRAGQRLQDGTAPAAADDLAWAAWGLALHDPKIPERAALLTRLAAEFRDEPKAQLLVSPSPALPGWPRAALATSLAGEPAATEWALATQPDLPKELARLLERRLAGVLDDPAGNPPGDMLAAAGRLVK